MMEDGKLNINTFIEIRFRNESDYGANILENIFEKILKIF